MNIDDAKGPDSIPVNIWPAIWQHQKQLHDKYKVIEQKSGIGYGVLNFSYKGDPPLDNPTFQYYLKDLFWRVTEELAEAQEAVIDGDVRHAEEELIDALHFMVEIYVVLNRPVPSDYWRIEGGDMTIYYLGLAANCLKNKPWKQTHMETDRAKFMGYLREAFGFLNGNFMQKFEIGKEREAYDWIFTNYFKKKEVNEFRQRSNY